jgi:ubiquinone/menaquinone biosynthesis C-methylase UbiE
MSENLGKGHVEAVGGYGSFFRGRNAKYLPFVIDFFKTLDTLDGCRLVDVAGGDGMRYSPLVWAIANLQSYTNLDMTPGALQMCRRDFLPNLPASVATSLIEADLRNTWPITDNTFNAVLATNCLHWFGEEHIVSLQNMYRVMVPGGLALVTTVTPYDHLITHEMYPKQEFSFGDV